jgi:hypothetical protein
MKKISELHGPELDYWVGKAEGLNVKLQFDGTWVYPPVSTASASSLSPTAHSSRYIQAYQPSTCWVHAGELIERHKICVKPLGIDSWIAEIHDDTINYHEVGMDPMIAACRCYVASVFGSEVKQLDLNVGMQ